MSLVQMLLLRALVVRFWKEPYRHPLAEGARPSTIASSLPHYAGRT